jgi:ATP-grasp domain.
MKYLVQDFSLQSIGLTSEKLLSMKNLTVVTKKENLYWLEDGGYSKNNIIFLSSISNEDLKSFFKSQSQTVDIEEIITLDEKLMKNVGILNELYSSLKSSQKSMNARLYTDKYVMRNMLINSDIKQPKFFKYNQENVESIILNDNYKESQKFVIKPRNGSGSKNINIVQKKDLKNFSKIVYQNEKIIEEHIPHTKMFTTDGIFKGRKILNFFIHEYEYPILENLEVSYGHITRSMSTETSIQLQETLYKKTNNVISKFNSEEIRPFHFEWFLTDNEEIVFCEGAARFGGKIAFLVNESYGTNLYDLYWNCVEHGVTENQSIQLPLTPNQITFNFAAYKWLGSIQEWPKLELENLSLISKVDIGEDIYPTYDILDPAFFINGNAENEFIYKKQIAYINLLIDKMKEK